MNGSGDLPFSLILGHAVSDEKVPCSHMLIGGNEARVSMVMLVTQSVSEGLWIVSIVHQERDEEKRAKLRKRVAHNSACDIQIRDDIQMSNTDCCYLKKMFNCFFRVHAFTIHVEKNERSLHMKILLNGAVKSYMIAPKSYAVHPRLLCISSIQLTFG